jgi:hypothetical protein
VGLKDNRRIVEDFSINNLPIAAILNRRDQEILQEEKDIRTEVEELRTQYGELRKIPELEIIQHGFVGLWTGNFNDRFILFKRLPSKEGFVIVK